MIFLAKTNSIPLSFRVAGVCPHFCHTYFCVEMVKLVRPKDTVDTYTCQNRRREAWFGGSMAGERGVMQGEQALFCWCGWNCSAVLWWPRQPRAWRRLCLLAWPLTGWWSLSFILFPFLSSSLALSFIWLFAPVPKAADPSGFTSFLYPGLCWH